MWIALLMITMVSAAWPNAPSADRLSKHDFEFQGLTRSFHLYQPPTAAEVDTALPLLVILHGSLGKPREFAGSWVGLAKANGFMVAAPAARRAAAWHIQVDGPQFIRAVVDEVARTHRVDRRRI